MINYKLIRPPRKLYKLPADVVEADGDGGEEDVDAALCVDAVGADGW